MFDLGLLIARRRMGWDGALPDICDWMTVVVGVVLLDY